MNNNMYFNPLTEYTDKPMVHPEIIEEMSPLDINELINEMTCLSQNYEARVCVSNETGFKHFFKIITGKQRKIRNQIFLDQNEINNLLCSLIIILNKKNFGLEIHLFNADVRMQYLYKLTLLNSMYLVRIGQDLNNAGISTADQQPLLEILKREHDNGYSTIMRPVTQTYSPNHLSTGKTSLLYNKEPNESASAIIDKYIYKIPRSYNCKAYNSKEIKNNSHIIDYFQKKITYISISNAIGFLDTSLFDNGKDGFLFTDKGLAYKKKFVRYDQIDRIEKTFSNCLRLHGNFTTTNSYLFIPNAFIKVDIFKMALEELKDISQNSHRLAR